MPPRRPPLETHGVGLPPAQWELLRQLAARHDRPVSWAVSAAIRMALERRPSLPEGDEWDTLQDVGTVARGRTRGQP